MEQPLALEVKGLCKGFRGENGRVQVLDRLSLNLEYGMFDAVMGSSGSGKSTLLHLLAGLLTPDQGEIHVGGVAFANMGDHELTCFRRRRIGIIFQDFNLVPTLTAEENILLPLLLDRRKPDPNRLDALLTELDLLHRRAHVPHQLSGGERQRVAIARAFITEPDLVLADEPTGNLDSLAGRTFCDLLRGMNREKRRTILLVSHDPVVAASANRVHLLKDGRFVDSFESGHEAALISQRYLAVMQRPCACDPVSVYPKHCA